MSKNKNSKSLPGWIPNIYKYSPIFSDLEHLLSQHESVTHTVSTWPNCQQLMDLVKPGLCSFSGQPISMHIQDSTLAYPKMSYEERIYKKGIISTREENWHDFFNAMIWVFFPETKKLLNLLHIKEMQHQSTSTRTVSRDAITHLDESGIIIASNKADLLEGLKNHQWLEVFYNNKNSWNKNISAYIFGHGMYEKALNPFIGFTGKMYPLHVDEYFFKQNRQQQYAQLDKLMSVDIDKTGALKNNNKMTPLPILGVPGWYKDNLKKSFYENTHYFRPAKIKT